MRLSPQTLTAKENALFDALARKTAFRGRLYRDGVPTPEAYLAQRVRVLFVFREPSYALDACAAQWPKRWTEKTGATWWAFSAAAHPRALLQLWHPAWRGDRWTLYEDVWASVREVARSVGLGQR